MVIPRLELDLENEATLQVKETRGQKNKHKEGKHTHTIVSRVCERFTERTCVKETYHVVNVLSNDGAFLLVSKGSDGNGNFVTRL